MINKVIVSLWIFLIGSNASHVYSRFGLHLLLAFAGAGYFLFLFRRRFLRLAVRPEFILLALLLLVVRIFWLLLSYDGSGTGPSLASVTNFMAFAVAAVLASRFDLKDTLTHVFFFLVAFGAALNLYELLIQNNVWSNAPGRSSGFYGEPNSSGQALLGYGLAFLLSRTTKVTLMDLAVICLTGVGVFATFSRTAIVMAALLMSTAVIVRSEPRHLARNLLLAVLGTLMILSFGSFVLQNVNLSGDAGRRIDNLMERGVGDYREDSEFPIAPLTPARHKIRRFLYLVRLDTNTQRDIPTLIEAFERIAVRVDDAELALVGGGDLLDETRAIVRSKSSAERIHVPGFDAPEKWLTWTDCFVLPSRKEGLSNALLEAMASGIPCIANDIPPNREVLDDGRAGILVPVGSIDALEAAMNEFVTTTAAVLYSHQARERIRDQYTIEAVAKRYGDLYERLSVRGSIER